MKIRMWALGLTEGVTCDVNMPGTPRRRLSPDPGLDGTLRCVSALFLAEPLPSLLETYFHRHPAFCMEEAAQGGRIWSADSWRRKKATQIPKYTVTHILSISHTSLLQAWQRSPASQAGDANKRTWKVRGALCGYSIESTKCSQTSPISTNFREISIKRESCSLLRILSKIWATTFLGDIVVYREDWLSIDTASQVL